MNKFKTFVFFDIEVTGLPHLEYNLTKITEICMIAATKDSIMSTVINELPRVIHKISLCINPFKRIQTRASEITGLDNYMLEHERKFDENSVELLSLFLSRLQQPVCLVAHNGDRFDFPILKKQLVKLNKCLPVDLWCVDSLPIFKKIDAEALKRSLSNQEDSEAANDVLAVPLEVPAVVNTSTSAEHSIAIAISTESMHENVELTDIKETLNDGADWFIANANQMRKQNETTPSHRPEKHSCKIGRRRPSTGNEISAIVRPVKSKRSLFPESQEGRAKPKLYNLVAIYERLHGEAPTTSHYAESDTITLMKCVIANKQEFIRFAEEDSKLFTAIQSL